VHLLWSKRVSKFEVSFERFLSVLQLLFRFGLIYLLLIVVYHVCLVNEDSQ